MGMGMTLLFLFEVKEREKRSEFLQLVVLFSSLVPGVVVVAS